jgi:hypothetical protein
MVSVTTTPLAAAFVIATVIWKITTAPALAVPGPVLSRVTTGVGVGMGVFCKAYEQTLQIQGWCDYVVAVVSVVSAKQGPGVGGMMYILMSCTMQAWQVIQHVMYSCEVLWVLFYSNK